MISGWLFNLDDKIKRELFFRLMRFAGDFILPPPGVDPITEGDKRQRESYRMMQQNPAPYSIDPSQLDMTVPEMRPTPYYPGQDLIRDKYIKFNPGSGIA
jgi:hypothetical protein|tara:strand:- start:68 stop:367 length:300 start_codon:yes stop_codon:yes gene_type:complete